MHCAKYFTYVTLNTIVKTKIWDQCGNMKLRLNSWFTIGCFKYLLTK